MITRLSQLRIRFRRLAAGVMWLVFALCIAGCGSSDAPAPPIPDVSGPWAFWTTYTDGDAAYNDLTFLTVEQNGQALTFRDDASGDEVAVGRVTADGLVQINWIYEDGEWRGQIKNLEVIKDAKVPDDWSIEGIVDKENPYGLTAWWAEHMKLNLWAAVGSEEPAAVQLTGLQKIIAAGDLTVRDDVSSPTGPSQEVTEGSLRCESRPWTETIAKKIDDMALIDADEGVLYPGALLQGEWLGRGELLPLTGILRAGGTLVVSSNLKFAEGAQVNRYVDVVSQSSVMQAISDLTSQPVTGTGAQITAMNKKVYNESQAALAMGTSFSYLGAKVKGNLNIDREQKRNHLLFSYTQTFYSIYFQVPTLPTDVFADGENFSDPLNLIKKPNPPMYISKMDYGRQLYLLVTTTESQTAVKATLEAAYQGFGIDANFHADINKRQVLANSEVKFWARGGDAGLVAQVLGGSGEQVYEKLKVLFSNEQAARFSPENPPAPLSYSVKYLATNLPVALNIGASYDKLDRLVAAAKPTWELKVENKSSNATLVVLRDGTTISADVSLPEKHGGTWDLSLDNNDDHHFHLKLTADKIWVGADFYVYRNGHQVAGLHYQHRPMGKMNFVDAQFKYNNAGSLEVEYCNRVVNKKVKDCKSAWGIQ